MSAIVYGSRGDKTGAFEAANGGTLFLDEVGNLTYETQVQLPAPRCERRFRPPGRVQTARFPVDIRLIAATNGGPAAIAASGGAPFRADLYHRINEFAARMPELRQMRGDIMLSPISSRRGEPGTGVATGKFRPGAGGRGHDPIQYDWPGNLRQTMR